MPQAVAGEEVVGPAAGLLDEDKAGEGVPGVHVQLAIAVDAPVGHIGERQRPRAAAPHARSGILQDLHERRVAAGRPARRPARLDRGLADVGKAADAHRPPVEGGAAAAPGGVELVVDRVVDDADLGPSVAHEGDRDAEQRDAAHEIGGAVDRVDHPHVGSELAAAFFAVEGVPPGKPHEAVRG